LTLDQVTGTALTHGRRLARPIGVRAALNARAIRARRGTGFRVPLVVGPAVTARAVHAGGRPRRHAFDTKAGLGIARASALSIDPFAVNAGPAHTIRVAALRPRSVAFDATIAHAEWLLCWTRDGLGRGEGSAHALLQGVSLGTLLRRPQPTAAVCLTRIQPGAATVDLFATAGTGWTCRVAHVISDGIIAATVRTARRRQPTTAVVRARVNAFLVVGAVGLFGNRTRGAVVVPRRPLVVLAPVTRGTDAGRVPTQTVGATGLDLLLGALLIARIADVAGTRGFVVAGSAAGAVALCRIP